MKLPFLQLHQKQRRYMGQQFKTNFHSISVSTDANALIISWSARYIVPLCDRPVIPKINEQQKGISWFNGVHKHSQQSLNQLLYKHLNSKCRLKAKIEHMQSLYLSFTQYLLTVLLRKLCLKPKKWVFQLMTVQHPLPSQGFKKWT